MTHKQALIGQPYAQRVNDVLEGLGICQCIGKLSTVRYVDDKEVCVVCNKPLVGWKWTPQVGEWVIYKWEVYLVVSHFVHEEGKVWINSPYKARISQKISDCTPILDWETIEEILEKAGYEVVIDRLDKRSCTIVPSGLSSRSEYKRRRIDISGNSRQSSVMEAVEAMGKEL